MKRDKNDLILLPDTEGTYKGIIYDLQGGYFSVSGLTYTSRGEKSNYVIGHFEDPRDAAYISEKFDEKYPVKAIRNIIQNGTFALTTNQFIHKTEIPKWKYPSVTEGSDGYDYAKVYVDNPSTALMEALETFDVEFDKGYENFSKSLDFITKMFKKGIPLRKAARQVIGVE